MAKKKSKRERSGGNSGGMSAVQQGHELNADAAREAQGSSAASGAAEAAVAAAPKAAVAAAPNAAVAAAPKAAEVTRSASEKKQEIYADVRAQREARRGRARNESAAQEAPAGYVRRSSLYLAVGLALAAGIFVGSLLPGLAGHNLPGTSGSPAVSGAPAAAEQGSQAQPPDKEDAATRLASHILELEDAVRKNPNDVAAWVQLGNLYFDSGKAPQSINAYERALLLKPDDANVLTDLGVMYREAGKYEQAVQSFRNASRVDPKHQNALFNRGVVLFFDLKRKEEGRKVWQELLILNPQAKAPDGRSLKDMLRDLK